VCIEFVDKINFDIELMARLGQTDGIAITIGLSCSAYSCSYAVLTHDKDEFH